MGTGIQTKSEHNEIKVTVNKIESTHTVQTSHTFLKSLFK